MSSKKAPIPVIKPSAPSATPGDFDALVSAIVRIHGQSQALAAKAVNTSLTMRNWLIGHRIVAFEQQGVQFRVPVTHHFHRILTHPC